MKKNPAFNKRLANNFHEPRQINKGNWYGLIKTAKEESTPYKVENTSRIVAKNELNQLARKINGKLTFFKQIN